MKQIYRVFYKKNLQPQDKAARSDAGHLKDRKKDCSPALHHTLPEPQVSGTQYGASVAKRAARNDNSNK